MKMNSFKLEILQLGPLETNCYLIADSDTYKCVVVDPADDAEYIMSVLENEKYHLEKIILTHGHYDHIGALETLSRSTGIDVWIHPDDSKMLTDANANFSTFLGEAMTFSGKINYLSDSEQIAIGIGSVKVIHTPGHTPGGICLLADDFLISGDTLFCQGIGRTDLPGGSTRQIMQSIREKLFVLDGEITVFPGHGPPTTIRKEAEGNAFFS